MDNDKNQNKKGLQKNVALEPFSKNSGYMQDEAAVRLRDTINQHKTYKPNLGNTISEAENTDENIEQTENEINTPDMEEMTTNGGISELRKTNSQRILEFLGFVPPSIIKNPILSYLMIFFASGILFLILIVIISTVISSRETSGKNQIASYLAYGSLEDENGSVSLIEYLQQGGWCEKKMDCIKTSAYQFLTTFRRKILEKTDEYQELNEKNSCYDVLFINEELTSLLMGTIFYNRANDEILSSDMLKSIHYEEELDYIINALFTQEFSGREDSCYILSKDSYKDEIIKSAGYIDVFRSDLGTQLSNESKLQIYEDILNEVNQFSKVTTGVQGTYVECSGVTVVDSDHNIIGTYSLEEYVAGVLSGEMYSDFPIESQKALAVAARTYVLSRTNSCRTAIESSSSKQNFNSSIQSFAREAANATAGQILVDSSGKIFSSEYDSWNCVGQNTCTYEKKPNGEVHEVTISDKYLNRAAGGHGRGMSQIAAADMASQGMNYEEILKFFYSDGVQITNLTKNSGLTIGGKFTSTAPLYEDANDLRNNSFYNPYAANVGQCVWYARSRAQEILYYSDMPTDMKNIAINSIKNTYGNGEAWYRNPDGNLFAKSTDVTQPRAGAIVSWSGGLNACTPNCGHVAIIESVNADGTVTISEGWKTTGKWDSNSWSTVNYRKFTTTLDYIKQHRNSSGDTYYFNGYVYLLG